MKRKCKNINIRDYKTLIPYVQDVIYRHNNRYDFKRLLIRNGLSVTDYYAFRETKDKSLLDDAIVKIAKVCAKGISTRNLDLPPIRIRIKVDKANDDIVWLWKTLLESHKVEGYEGFMIGSLVSQWACQYMMSFLYRYAKGLHYERRGITYQSITHAMLFMDDQLYLGSNRKELKIAIEKIVIYANDVLGFSTKPNWHIYSLEDKSIDMMGYTISSTGQVEIRDRNFIRTRRMCIRYENQGNFLTYRQCRRICSYKGYFLNSNTDYAYKKYNFKEIVTYASQKISEQERSKNAIQEC